MWLKLGDTELINLDYISSIKKTPHKPSIEIIYHDLSNVKALHFPNEEERDKAFHAIVENLSRMRLIFQ